jgi:transcriptional regulator with XRE-family HTH domain
MRPFHPRTLRNLRAAHGLTQAGAAALVHVSPGAVDHWEAARAKPDPARWELLLIKLDAHERYGQRLGAAETLDELDARARIGAELDALLGRVA